jgi:hypothetical protein
MQRGASACRTLPDVAGRCRTLPDNFGHPPDIMILLFNTLKYNEV